MKSWWQTATWYNTMSKDKPCRYVSVCLSICLSICLSVYTSVCLSVVQIYIFLSVYLSIRLSVYLSGCLSIYMSVCFSVWLADCFVTTPMLLITAMMFMTSRMPHYYRCLRGERWVSDGDKNNPFVHIHVSTPPLTRPCEEGPTSAKGASLRILRMQLFRALKPISPSTPVTHEVLFNVCSSSVSYFLLLWKSSLNNVFENIHLFAQIFTHTCADIYTHKHPCKRADIRTHFVYNYTYIHT